MSVSFGGGAGGDAGQSADQSANGAAGNQAAEQAAPEKSIFDVVLQGYNDSDKVKLIKEVKNVLALGLKEAKELVDKVPSTLAKGLSKKDAEALVEKLKTAGGKFELV